MKENNNQILLFLFVSIFFLSCTSKKKEEKGGDISYKLFELKEAGWKSKQITHFSNNIHYRATEVPIEYYLLKAEGNNLAAIDSIAKQHQKERIIEFEFEHINEEDLLQSGFTNLDYDKSVNYMSSIIRQDFLVVTQSGDTIPCNGVLFERHFKISPFKRVLLFFSGITPNENIQLIYHDKLFNNGIFKYTFKEMPIKT